MYSKNYSFLLLLLAFISFPSYSHSQTWENITGLATTSATVNCLTSDGNIIFVGGGFTTIYKNLAQ